MAKGKGGPGARPEFKRGALPGTRPESLCK